MSNCNKFSHFNKQTSTNFSIYAEKYIKVHNNIVNKNSFKVISVKIINL